MKLGKVKYLDRYDDLNELEDHFQETNKKDSLTYFTDTHYGNMGHFRSDNINDVIEKEVIKIFEFAEMFLSPILHGGDMIDKYRLMNNHELKSTGITPPMIIKLYEWSKRIFQYCLGNHDYRKETDVENSLMSSAIYVFNRHFHNKNLTSGFELFIKHFKPVMDKEYWNTSLPKILMTHEPLYDGTTVFKTTNIQEYQTDADIVLMADIHEHQGVKVYNDTIFISCGSSSRTKSNERDKETYFTHIVYNRKENLIDVYFIPILSPKDDPKKYWTKVTELSKKEIKPIEEIQIDSIKVYQESIDKQELEEESLDFVIEKIAKENFNCNDDEISEMKGI
jgi:predicted phosphodiesterase